jgi:hypothetical protein
MKMNDTTFVVIAIVAALALVGVVAITIVSMPLQQADAAKCDRNLVAVCGVCRNADVRGTEFSQRCNP